MTIYTLFILTVLLLCTVMGCAAVIEAVRDRRVTR